MTRKLLILNSPPEGGKDHLKECFLSSDEATEGVEFKTKLLELFGIIYDLSEEKVAKMMQRHLKELPMDSLGGRSPREALIHISEDVIKPMFGRDYFGKSLLRQCKIGNYTKAVASDGGFVEEITPFIKDGWEVTILQVYPYRNGELLTFKKDSRSYVNRSDFLPHLTQEEMERVDVLFCNNTFDEESENAVMNIISRVLYA